jgi:hypothetical protein
MKIPSEGIESHKPKASEKIPLTTDKYILRYG